MLVLPVYVKHYRHQHVKSPNLICMVIRSPTCKVTELDLSYNQITDAGVASLCQALQTPTCKVTELHLRCNQITDAGVASLCEALQTPTCKVTRLFVDGDQITKAVAGRLMYILEENCRIWSSDHRCRCYLSMPSITDTKMYSHRT